LSSLIRRKEKTWRHPKLRASYFWFLGFKCYRIVAEEELDRDNHFAYVSSSNDLDKALVCSSDDEASLAVESLANKEVHPDHPEYPPWKFNVFYKETSG
jgi:hypothetical protein